MSERRVVILGGGVSGLASAEAVARHAEAAGTPTRVLVLEAEPVPGGKVRSAKEAGFVVETGPHGFLDKEPKMFALIDRLGLRDRLVSANTHSARRFILRGGRLREVPMSPPSFLTSDILPWTGKLRLLFEPFMPGPSVEEESVRQFAARRIGPQAADVLVDAMVTGIYGGDPNRLGLRAAFPRMFELERDHGSLVRAQFAVAKERKRQRALDSGALVPAQAGAGAPTGTLHSFRDGLSTLTDALAARTEVRCDVRAEQIERFGPGWRVKTTDGAIEADAVISTVPSFVAAPLFAAHAPADAAQIEGIPYVPCSVVVQAFRKDQVRRSVDGFGFLVPGGERRDVLGTIWASTVFPDHAPDGTVMFRSMLGGARRPELGAASREELAKRARLELEDLMGLDPNAEPLLERVIPWPKAIPQYDVGHHRRVEAADRIEAALPGCFMGGNAFRGVAVLACVADADRMGERVVAYLGAQTARLAS